MSSSVKLISLTLEEASVYLLGTASPLHDTNGAIVGAIETIRDITDQRQDGGGTRIRT